MESNLFSVEEKQNFMENIWKKYYTSITQNVSKLNVNSLNDIDWRFGVTVSSSELAEVGGTFLQLKLNINGKDEYIELDLPQFYHFLHEMEKGKSLLDFFSE
jgi:COMM domain containing 7